MRYKIFTDGASRGNPGIAGAGYIIYDVDSNIIKEEALPLGITTNNVAEYSAVIAAAKYLLDNLQPIEFAEFFLDSELIVKQIKGEYRVKDQKMKKLFLDLSNILNHYPYSFTHVRREFNKVADKLSNIGCDMNSDR